MKRENVSINDPVELLFMDSDFRKGFHIQNKLSYLGWKHCMLISKMNNKYKTD